MKYTVTAYTENEQEYTATVNVRRDAKMLTLFRRCMNEIGHTLIEAKELPADCTYSFELPNVWRNGFVGAAWFNKPFINVTIQGETGAWLAM